MNFTGGSLVTEANLDKANEQALFAAADAADTGIIAAADLRRDLLGFRLWTSTAFVGWIKDAVLAILPASFKGDKGDTGNTGPGGGLIAAVTRTDLAALADRTRGAFLQEAGRAGEFVWKSGNYAAKIAADPRQGIYVAAASDPTGTTGAWVRIFVGYLNVRWFGAVGDNITDDGAAFLAAVALLKALSTAGGAGYGTIGGGKVFAPAGIYWLNTTTLDITFAMTLEGEGTGLQASATTGLRWAANTTGIRVQSWNTTGATGVITPAPNPFTTGYPTVRNLTLMGPKAGVTEGEYHAVHCRSVVSVEDVGIFDFQGDGVHVEATAGSGGATEGNANQSFFKRVFVQNNRNGFFFKGADSNACTIMHCSAVINRAWGFNDQSFLGNTYIGCHTDSNGLVPGATPCVTSYGGFRYSCVKTLVAAASVNPPSGTIADNAYWYCQGPGGVDAGNNIPAWVSGTVYRDGGSYRNDGDGNANTAYLGCYNESAQIAQIDAPALVVGGSMRPAVRGVPVLFGSNQYISSSGGFLAQGNLQSQGNNTVLGTRGTVPRDFTLDLLNTSTESGIWFWRNDYAIQDGYMRMIAGTLYVNATNSLHLRAAGNEVAVVSPSGLDIADGASLSHAGVKVVGARETGWTASTGPTNKGAYASAAAPSVSAAYTQAEVQGLADRLAASEARVVALEAALRTHGLIN